MNITDVKVHLVNEDRLKAYVVVTFDDCFAVRDIKIIQGPNHLFVSMPNKKRKDGQFRDIAHPLNQEMRTIIENAVFAEYEKAVRNIADKIENLTTRTLPSFEGE